MSNERYSLSTRTTAVEVSDDRGVTAELALSSLYAGERESIWLAVLNSGLSRIIDVNCVGGARLDKSTMGGIPKVSIEYGEADKSQVESSKPRSWSEIVKSPPI